MLLLLATVPLLTALSLLTACEYEPQADKGKAPALDQLPATVPEPEESAWLADHWTLPIPAQGPAPEGWTELEASLAPEACGICHPQQLADWQESWHAGGMGPGLMGQLVDWDNIDDRTVLQCQACHAPMTEQHPRLRGSGGGDGEGDGEGYVDNPLFDPAMRVQGLTCAGCHVRQHTRSGPEKPGRPANTDGVALAGGPHDGFVPRDEYKSADFCAVCHDFKETQLALEGKLLQETGPEWRRTPQAAEGVTCQGCHMPEGRHLWKGIHDPEIVAQGVTITGALDEAGGWFSPVQAELRLENTGTGHRLPTYSTPEIKLFLVQVDAQGAPLEGTERQGSIHRRITPNLKKELYDTRLMPGEHLTLPYATRRHSDAVALQARVEVWPDEAYRRFYAIKLRHPENYPNGEAQMRQALQNSIDSRYVLWEERWAL